MKKLVTIVVVAILLGTVVIYLPVNQVKAIRPPEIPEPLLVSLQ